MDLQITHYYHFHYLNLNNLCKLIHNIYHIYYHNDHHNHQKNIKHKIEIEKNIIIQKQAKKLKQKDKELQDLKNIEKEYFEFMKKVVDKNIKGNN